MLKMRFDGKRLLGMAVSPETSSKKWDLGDVVLRRFISKMGVSPETSSKNEIPRDLAKSSKSSK